ncbi:MAG: hypothetical protein EA415_09315 [Sphaerobacteraceae bacterium]|nr:MAG: hypothetical protein EA415_09315 [Sphaerobacteraceae bacterium]
MANLREVERVIQMSQPRGPGSDEERQMASFVAGRLERLGVPHTQIDFRTVRGTATLYLVPFLGILVSIGLAWFYPLAGLIGSTIFALIAVLEATNRPLISRIFRLDKSQNVLGLIPHQPPEGFEDADPLRQVVLIAPLDSPRLGWLDGRTMRNSIRGLTLLALFSVMAIPLMIAAWLFLEEELLLFLAGIPAFIVFLSLFFIMQRDLAGKAVPGRNSNGSGIAAMLAMAEDLMRHPPVGVETLLVFTGASQSGSAGMTNFLGENEFNPETTYFISLESVGRGPICFTRAEGPIFSLQSSPGMVHIAGEIALSHPERLMRPIVHRGIPTEQYAALIRGYQAMTIMGHPDPKESTAPPEAVAGDEIDPYEIDSACLLVHGIIRRLDDEAVSGNVLGMDYPD